MSRTNFDPLHSVHSPGVQVSSQIQQLHAAQEKERTRIARQVHDELGQPLTALKLDLAWIERQLAAGNQKEVLEKIGAMTQLVEQIIVEVRQIATDLRPGLLDHVGLHAALEWLLKDFTRRSGIASTLLINPVDIDIDKNVAIILFRVAQEALTNVIRHANATHLKITLCQYDGHLKLDIQDNGRGISRAAAGNLNSLGLMGARERVKSVHGRLKISGSRGHGTLLAVDIPRESAGALH